VSPRRGQFAVKGHGFEKLCECKMWTHTSKGETKEAQVLWRAQGGGGLRAGVRGYHYSQCCSGKGKSQQEIEVGMGQYADCAGKFTCSRGTNT